MSTLGCKKRDIVSTLGSNFNCCTALQPWPKVVETNSTHHRFHEKNIMKITFKKHYPPQYNVGCCVWTKSSQHCSRGNGGDSQIIAVRLLKHSF